MALPSKLKGELVDTLTVMSGRLDTVMRKLELCEEGKLLTRKAGLQDIQEAHTYLEDAQKAVDTALDKIK